MVALWICAGTILGSAICSVSGCWARLPPLSAPCCPHDTADRLFPGRHAGLTAAVLFVATLARRSDDRVRLSLAPAGGLGRTPLCHRGHASVDEGRPPRRGAGRVGAAPPVDRPTGCAGPRPPLRPLLGPDPAVARVRCLDQLGSLRPSEPRLFRLPAPRDRMARSHHEVGSRRVSLSRKELGRRPDELAVATGAPGARSSQPAISDQRARAGALVHDAALLLDPLASAPREPARAQSSLCCCGAVGRHSRGHGSALPTQIPTPCSLRCGGRKPDPPAAG